MVDISEAVKLLPEPNNRLNVITANAANSDIINALNSLVQDATIQVKELAPKFKKANTKKTAFAIWYFLRTRAQYVRDSNEWQLIRLPSRFVRDTHLKSNSGDCKSFALFTVAILRSLGLPAFLRYAGYNKNKLQPSHVYAYTQDRNGKTIIIDGCYPYFDKEKKYTFVKNYDTMNVASLSGFNTGKNLLNWFRSLPKEERQKIRKRLMLRDQLKNNGRPVNGLDDETINKKLTPEQKAKRKAKVKKGLKKFGRVVAFASLAIGRGAYLALVALNVNAFATKLKKLQKEKSKKNPKKTLFDERILPFWKKIGGIPKLLQKAIDKGAKHKPLFLSKKAKARYNKQFGVGSADYIGDVDSINAIPVAAAAAAAIPVVAAIIPVMIKAFASIGKRKEANELAQQGKDVATEEMARPDFKQHAAQAGEDLQTGDDSGDDVSGLYGADYSDLFKSLGQVAAVGVERLGAAIHKKTKKNPKALAAVTKIAQAGDDYATGAYLREKGVTPKLKGAKSMFDDYGNLLLPLAVGLAAFAFFKKSK